MVVIACFLFIRHRDRTDVTVIPVVFIEKNGAQRHHKRRILAAIQQFRLFACIGHASRINGEIVVQKRRVGFLATEDHETARHLGWCVRLLL